MISHTLNPPLGTPLLIQTDSRAHLHSAAQDLGSGAGGASGTYGRCKKGRKPQSPGRRKTSKTLEGGSRLPAVHAWSCRGDTVLWGAAKSPCSSSKVAATVLGEPLERYAKKYPFFFLQTQQRTQRDTAIVEITLKYAPYAI